MSDARAVIAHLRRGEEPSARDLAWFAQGLADGTVSAAQGGAFAMGICLRGLSESGRVALTLAMRDSGRVLDWDLPGPVVDKHSTGGVGDCVSLESLYEYELSSSSLTTSPASNMPPKSAMEGSSFSSGMPISALTG